MQEFDLRNEIPSDATTIEIYAMVKPPSASVEIRRSPEDDEAIIMSNGTRTTMGVPAGRKLYLSPSALTQEFKIFVAGWFRDRIEHPSHE